VRSTHGAHMSPMSSPTGRVEMSFASRRARDLASLPPLPPVDVIYKMIAPQLALLCPRVIPAKAHFKLKDKPKKAPPGRKPEIPQRAWLALESRPAIRKILQEKFNRTYFPNKIVEEIAARWWGGRL